jgi:hypothetical protein
MASGGLLFILSAVYEWTWIRKLEQSLFFLNRVNWNTARILYLITGMGGLGIGIAGICSFILSSNSPVLAIIGLSSAYLFANTLLNYRNNQSILELFRNNKA